MKSLHVLAAVLAATLVCFVPAGETPAQTGKQARCPDPNSSPTGQMEGNRPVCKCNEPDYVFWKGRCQIRVAVEDELQLKIIATLKGMKSTTESIAADRNALILQTIRDQWTVISVSIGGAVLARQPALLAPEAMRISADLGKIMGDVRACNATPDIKTSCDNLAVFRGTLMETADQLVKIQAKAKK